MAQFNRRSQQLLGVILLLAAIVLAIVLWYLVGQHGLLAGVAPIVILAVVGVLFLSGVLSGSRRS